MITVKPSPTADTRTCDVTKVTKEQLYDSSVQHIQDVQQALGWMQKLLGLALVGHDADKLLDIEGFYHDFSTGFKSTTWWDNHRKITRHHLNMEDGIPNSVNLIDIIEYICDCVMAGTARSGSVRPLEMTSELLMEAFINTVELLKMEVRLEK